MTSVREHEYRAANRARQMSGEVAKDVPSGPPVTNANGTPDVTFTASAVPTRNVASAASFAPTIVEPRSGKGPEHHGVSLVEHERVPDEHRQQACRHHRIRHKEHRQLRQPRLDPAAACSCALATMQHQLVVGHRLHHEEEAGRDQKRDDADDRAPHLEIGRGRFVRGKLLDEDPPEDPERRVGRRFIAGASPQAARSCASRRCLLRRASRRRHRATAASACSGGCRPSRGRRCGRP